MLSEQVGVTLRTLPNILLLFARCSEAVQEQRPFDNLCGRRWDVNAGGPRRLEQAVDLEV